jgi:methyl-accepting chemotaxis protein
MSEEEKEGTSIEIGGIKFTGGKMMIIATALSTAGGALWGGFEIYKDYMDMKEKIQSYEAPDLSKFQEQLSVMQNEMKKVQESVAEARDYTRDIKLDIKKDVDRIESVSDKTEQRVKDIQEITRETIANNENKVRGLIDIASQRFDNKRDELRNESDRKMKDLEDRMNSKLQRALDNPLADK